MLYRVSSSHGAFQATSHAHTYFLVGYFQVRGAAAAAIGDIIPIPCIKPSPATSTSQDGSIPLRRRDRRTRCRHERADRSAAAMPRQIPPTTHRVSHCPPPRQRQATNDDATPTLTWLMTGANSVGPESCTHFRLSLLSRRVGVRIDGSIDKWEVGRKGWLEGESEQERDNHKKKRNQYQPTHAQLPTRHEDKLSRFVPRYFRRIFEQQLHTRHR